jgi:parvulin-like peptidyl-prolyl isomerase
MRKILVSSLASLTLAGSLFASDVVATVNGEKITKDEINSFLKPMIGPNASIDMIPQKEAKEKLINQVIEKKLLADNAIKSGIKKSREYRHALERMEGELALEMWMRSEFEKISVSDSEAKKYYETNKESKFKQEEQVKARHILVKDESDAKDIISELSKAKDVKSKFIALAKEKSTGPSGANGGDLGFFNKKQMVPEFSAAAFSQKVGEVSKTPIKTQFGYHIIYVDDKKEGGYANFDDVKAQVIQFLKMEKFKEHTANKAKELRESAKIKINL